MTNREEETRILDELADRPVQWFTERPEKVKRLLDWHFELPMWRWKEGIFVKYLDVLRSAGLERCFYCGQWVEAKRIVRIDTDSSYPSSGTWLCCEGTCEIELLRSR